MGWLSDFSTIHQGLGLPDSWDPWGEAKRDEAKQRWKDYQRQARYDDRRAMQMAMWQGDHNRASMAPDMIARVEAAKAAGVHPLAAMGMSSPSASVNVSSSGGSYSDDDAAGDLGGLPWTPSRTPKPSAAEKEMENLSLRRARADADLAEVQVGLARQRLSGQPGQAPMASGAASVGAVKVEPSEVKSRMPGVPYAEAGVTPGGQYTDTPAGRLWLPTSDALSELEALSYGLIASDLFQRLGRHVATVRNPKQGQDMGYWQRIGRKVPRRMKSIQADYHGGAYR